MLRVADQHAGNRIQCPSCHAALPVLQPAGTPASTTAPPHSAASAPQQPAWNSAVAAQPNRSQTNSATWWLIGCAAGLFGFLCIAGLAIIILLRAVQPTRLENSVSIAETEQTSVATPRSPADFPDLGASQQIGGVKVSFVDLAQTDQSGQPAAGTKLRIYLPAGETSPQSIPLVLVAPAGTPLIYGNEVDDGDYHDETLPYATAGMAVIMYSLDGPMPDADSMSEAQAASAISAAYKKFKAADGGLANARIAIEYALAKLPQVDPQRIYSAGHSSAGTISLLLALQEPRIAAGVAYAPATDLESRLGDLVNDAYYQRMLPELRQFVNHNSPLNHVRSAERPLFVFHAKDDSNEPFETTQAFVNRLKQANKNVTFSTVDRGDHYQPMIDQGIPRAIQWLKQLPPIQ